MFSTPFTHLGHIVEKDRGVVAISTRPRLCNLAAGDELIVGVDLVVLPRDRRSYTLAWFTLAATRAERTASISTP